MTRNVDAVSALREAFYKGRTAQFEEAVGRVESLALATVELLVLKDGARDASYRRRKPAAWSRLRGSLERFEGRPQPGDDPTWAEDIVP